MNKISNAISGLRSMDELAAQNSFIHSLHPLVKLLLTIIYIFVTVSFNKYNLTGLVVMVIYPVLMFQMSGIPVRACFKKLWVALSLVCAVGIFNPFFDREIAMHLSSLPISFGVISMLTLMMKGVFSLMASFILIATTGIDKICYALRLLHIPNIIVTLVLITYRYISVMLEEVNHMTEAYAIRAPGQRGVHFTAWGSMLGQLLFRSMDRATELYQSMELRGYNGAFYYADVEHATAASYIFFAVCAVLFFLVRFFNISVLLGSLFA
ncbi:MAG: cobalt ECF transporter T component CbiQ [Oscillospiraceae bacterium]